MYGERPSQLTGSVIWHRVTDGRPARILPDGCIDIIWSEGALFVAGPDTRAHMSSSPAGTVFAGLRFAPGVGPAVLSTSAGELVDRRVALDLLWPARTVRLLVEQLADATPSQRGAILERAVQDRFAMQYEHVATAAATTAMLRRGDSVAQVASALGLSERQLHRRSLDAFGYGPKTLAQILRMNDALDLARSGVPFAETAIASGYADQSHLSRDVRRLAGASLGQLTR